MNSFDTQSFLNGAMIINSFYLFITLSKKRYRLLLPSVVCSFTWMVACVIMLFEINGFLKSSIHSDLSFVAPFIFYMTIVSVVAFSTAHFVCRFYPRPSRSPLISDSVLISIIKNFRWVLIIVALCAVVILTTLLSIGGGFGSLGSYRELAVTTNLQGIPGLAIRIANHLSLIGAFYLIILGIKHARCGVDVRELILCVVLYGTSNMAIAGRGWIIAACLPYINGYFFENFRLLAYNGKSRLKKDKKKIVSFAIIVVAMFAMIGSARSDANGASTYDRLFSKFLYYTDGSHVADIVLKKYKPNSFQLEYGTNTLLQYGESHMAQSFNQKTGRQYEVIVKSIIPSMYYDFGYEGALVFWGLLCFVLEVACLRLRFTHSIFGALLFCSLSCILYQSPIGTVTKMAIPSLEWLLILFVFRKPIFSGIKGVTPYL